MVHNVINLRGCVIMGVLNNGLEHFVTVCILTGFFFNCQLSNTNRLLMLINLDSCQLIQRLLNQTAFYKKCIGRNSKEFSR